MSKRSTTCPACLRRKEARARLCPVCLDRHGGYFAEWPEWLQFLIKDNRRLRSEGSDVYDDTAEWSEQYYAEQREYFEAIGDSEAAEVYQKLEKRARYDEASFRGEWA